MPKPATADLGCLGFTRDRQALNAQVGNSRLGMSRVYPRSASIKCPSRQQPTWDVSGLPEIGKHQVLKPATADLGCANAQSMATAEGLWIPGFRRALR